MKKLAWLSLVLVMVMCLGIGAASAAAWTSDKGETLFTPVEATPRNDPWMGAHAEDFARDMSGFNSAYADARVAVAKYFESIKGGNQALGDKGGVNAEFANSQLRGVIPNGQRGWEVPGLYFAIKP